MLILLALALALVATSPTVRPMGVGAAKGPARSANWSAFAILSDSTAESSREFVDSFPMYRYWDTLKGSYCVGTLGQLVRTLFPDVKHLTSKVRRKVNHAGRLYDVDQFVVDYTQVYMHMLVTIGYLSRLSDELNFILSQHDTIKRQEEIANLSALPGNLSFADVAAEREILSLKAQKVDALLAIEKVKHDAFVRMHSLKLGFKVAGKTDLHHNISSAELAHHLQWLQSQEQHQTARRTLARQLSENDSFAQLEVLRHEHLQAIEQLQLEHDFRQRVLDYRLEEELRYLQSKKDDSLTLLDKRMNLLRQGTETIVDVVMKEAGQIFFLAFGTWERALRVIQCILVALVVGVTLIEVSKSVKWMVKSFWRRGKTLQSHRTGSTSLFSSLSKLPVSFRSPPRSLQDQVLHEFQCYTKEKCLIYDPEASASLLSWLLSLTLAASERTVYLPNVLLCGPPGCGKTLTAELLMDVSHRIAHCQFVWLSGADLLSLHEQASLFMQELLECYRRKRVKVVIAIDEVDVLIAHRGKWKEDNGRASPLLYTFLDQLKSSSLHVGVVFTTRLELSAIDPAILDRIDGFLHFPLPDTLQRALFIWTQCQAHLLSFLRGDEQALIAVDEDSRRRTAQEVCQRLEEISSLHEVFGDIPVESGYSRPEVFNEMDGLSCQVTRQCLRQNMAVFETNRFQWIACLQVMVVCSSIWSLRDIHKKVMNIRYSVLSQPVCTLSTSLWMKELSFDDL